MSTIQVTGEKQLLEAKKDILGYGGEGIVLRSSSSPYSQGYSADFLKDTVIHTYHDLFSYYFTGTQ